MGFLDSIPIVNAIPETISVVFQRLGTFLDGTELFVLNIYVFLTIMIYFLIIALLIFIPTKFIYPAIRDNQQIIKKVINLRRG